ncbi:MAG: JAB domain-containing protein [Polyangiaceae bacterium]
MLDLAISEPRTRRSRQHRDVELLTDAELVVTLLKTSHLPLARRLLQEHGGLVGLSRSGEARLAAGQLVTRAEARRLSAAVELGRRSVRAGLSEVPEIIDSFERVVEWARPGLAALDHEEVWLLSVDGRNALRSARRIARGGQHGCALSAKDVLSPALRDAASGIILVHNHPSGSPEPSPEDVLMTESLASACEVVGLVLLDHVIVARCGASSILAAARER